MSAESEVPRRGQGRSAEVLPALRTDPSPVKKWVHWSLWAMPAVLAVVYAVDSVRLHQRMLTSGYDLGIFEQMVRSYAHGDLPVVELKGPGYNELGDHFSPIVATLAPFYRLWPSPYVLLLAQAVLMAAAVVPLSRWALGALGPVAALIVGLGYGLSWGIASAVGFDFHEVAFAVPLVSFSLCALGQGRPRAAALWALPLLLVKEDLGLTVAVIGLLIAWRGRRRLGLATAVVGVVGTLLEVLVIIPAFNPTGRYPYLNHVLEGSGGFASLVYRSTVGLVAAPDPKPVTLVLLIAPTAFMALRSPLVWAAAPTLLWRLSSNNSLYWETRFQYSAVLMPIVFAALIDGLVHKPVDQRLLRHTLIVVAAVTALLLPPFPLFQAVQPSAWHTPARVAAARQILARVPDGATVAASNLLVPQLSGRTSVTEFGMPGSRPDPEWIIVDTTAPRTFPVGSEQQAQLIDEAIAQGYRTEAHVGEYLLLRRPVRAKAARPSSPQAHQADRSRASGAPAGPPVAMSSPNKAFISRPTSWGSVPTEANSGSWKIAARIASG
ncbi:DUF2079 domain-containing protein [Streptomyces sp. NPDC005283]|uniref:DUF2079 domain-containing protein n=1 Tax=Streptomyces sp. NPDC005283 TaxID=3156871 RepID=UPI0034556CBD